jgi:hypothetical protein
MKIQGVQFEVSDWGQMTLVEHQEEKRFSHYGYVYLSERGVRTADLLIRSQTLSFSSVSLIH